MQQFLALSELCRIYLTQFRVQSLLKLLWDGQLSPNRNFGQERMLQGFEGCLQLKGIYFDHIE
jgi:hypothetical protein